jgi:hypothetical protein
MPAIGNSRAKELLLAAAVLKQVMGSLFTSTKHYITMMILLMIMMICK